MRLKIKEFNIYLDEAILFVSFFSIIFKGIRKYFENYFICFLFITFHEFSHMLIASLFGVKATRLNIRVSGLSINLNKKERQGIKWLIIYLAGPISNIILANIFKNVSMVNTINLVLAIINLMPVYPLDGYNIFDILLNWIVKNKKLVLKIKKITEIMVIISVVIIGMYQFIIFKNLSIILMSFYIFIQSSNLRNNSSLGMYQKCYKNITNFQKNY